MRSACSRPKSPVCAFVLALALATLSRAQPAFLTFQLPGASRSAARCVNRDGTVVYGTANVGPGGVTCFVWTELGGIDAIPVPVASSVTACSDDGNFVIGHGPSGAFRWSADLGTEFLGELSCGAAAIPIAVSVDGSVIVGYSQAVQGIGEPCRIEPFVWTPTGGMSSLGVPFDARGAVANGLSGDGSRWAGTANWPWPNPRSCVFSSREPILLIGYPNSICQGMSLDGRVVIGYTHLGGQGDAGFRRVDGMTMFLGLTPVSTNFDGSAIVSTSPLLWTENGGTVALLPFLATLGLDLTGWSVTPGQISSDGSAIVGEAARVGTFQSTGFIVKLTCPVGTPISTTAPIDARTCTQLQASFSLEVLSGIADSYQWLKDGVAISQGQNSTATTDTLLLDQVLPADAGRYSCVVSGPCGQVTTREAVLTVCDNRGDLNCDGVVDLSDLSALLTNFGRADSPPRYAGNVNGDAFVDLSDLSTLLSEFGAGC